jgi:hypothetical protein
MRKLIITLAAAAAIASGLVPVRFRRSLRW